ncbi:MAG: MotA/TolQ/ExbB proton channel family protein, partial [Planctomycetota bacterium]|nr:MotA/TolQ/ExbB proton channel family protein [Planctomycetota bacterium]
GLVVAIPALAGYALIRNAVDALTSESTLAAEDLFNRFRPAPEPDSAAASASSARGAAPKAVA